MERVPKPFLMLTIFLIAFLTTSTTIEGGRDIPSDNEVSDPQSFSASSPSFDPSSFPRYPWFGGFKGADQASSKDKTDDSRGPYGDDRSLSNQQWGIHGSKEAGIDKNQGLYDARFPIFHHWGFPWFWGIHGSKEAGIDKNQGLYDARFPIFHHRGFPWFGGIHGSKEAGIDKNQGLYDARFPIFHHWGFPWLPWFGGIKAEATMKDMATGGHGYGDPAKATDGSKVAAGETP